MPGVHRAVNRREVEARYPHRLLVRVSRTDRAKSQWLEHQHSRRQHGMQAFGRRGPRSPGALRWPPGRTGSRASASRSSCGSPGMASRRPPARWPASRASSIAAPAACSATSIAFSSLPRGAARLGRQLCRDASRALVVALESSDCATQGNLGLQLTMTCV